MKKLLITLTTVGSFFILGNQITNADTTEISPTHTNISYQVGKDTFVQLDDETVLVLKDYDGTIGKDFGIIEPTNLFPNNSRVPNSMKSSTTLWYASNNYPRKVYTEKSKSYQQGGGYKVYVYKGYMNLSSVQTGGNKGGYSVFYSGTLYR